MRVPIRDTPLLVLGEAECRAIARLRARAEAAPTALADTLARQRRAVAGRALPDPPERRVMLRFFFQVAYVLEEYPDGLWRRLSITSRRGAAEPHQIAVVMREFGFKTTLSTALAWRAMDTRGSTFTVAELVEKRAARVVAFPATPLAAAPEETETGEDIEG